MYLNTSYTFLGESTSGTITHETTGDIDFKIDGKYMMFGVQMVYKDAAFGDYLAFQIVDKDNVLGYGANTVLSDWVKKWYVPHTQNEWTVLSPLAKELPVAGLYARLKYTSVGLTDVSIKINYSMIWP